MFPSKRDQFLSTFLRQRFSLPDSMIYYILKNPATSKVYQKMIQSCKYFFVKNPILVFHCLKIDDGGWTICSGDCKAQYFTKKIYINKETLSGCKLWIQNELHISSTNSTYASDLIPAIFQCDVEALFLQNQKLSFQNFLFYSKIAKRFWLDIAFINSDADSEVSLEKIVASLPNIQTFVIECDPYCYVNVSSDTVKKLIQITHFKNISFFALKNIPEEFDINAYYNYYKNSNTKISFEFFYQNLPSEDYAKKLEGILSEIKVKETLKSLFGQSDRSTPIIEFPGQDLSKLNALYQLYFENSHFLDYI